MTPLQLRISRISTAGLVLVCSLSTAAQSPLTNQPNQREKQKLAGQIASEGLNCPVVGVVEDAGKDERGTMIRIPCRSVNGSANRDIRGIFAKGAAELRFEAW
jgi:hypothetical protein